MKVSVIICGYNCEKTISKSIQSVLNQSYQNFELIVVDDGSSDNTKKQVLSFNDQRIKYFFQTNKGIASARSLGLKNVSGQYFIYLDSDDYFEQNCLAVLVNQALKYSLDIVVCDYRYVFEDTTKDMSSLSFSKTTLKESPWLLYEVMPQVWNKLVKTEIIQKNHIDFIEGLVFEDLYFYVVLINSLCSIAKVDQVLVNYVQSGSSIMAQAKKLNPKIYHFDQIIEAIYQYYIKNNLNIDDHLEALFVLNAKELINGIFKNEAIAHSDKQQAFNSILNNITKIFKHWYRNKVYLKRYKSFGLTYLIKLRILDILLTKKCYKWLWSIKK